MTASFTADAVNVYDDRAHHDVVRAVLGRLTFDSPFPDGVLRHLTSGEARSLSNGLEWALLGEATSDAFLRFLARERGPLGLDAPSAPLPASEVSAIRKGGVGAAALATIVAASTNPGHFVSLLEATEDEPFWDRLREARFEDLMRCSPVPPGGPPVDGRSGADDTVPNGPRVTPTLAPPPAGAVSVARAVERCAYRKLTGAAREEFQTGLGAWSVTARRALARATAVELWGSDTLDLADARAHYLTAAAAIRSLLAAWARAQTDGLPLKSSPWIEQANDRSLVFPKTDFGDCDWLAAHGLYVTTAAADPVAAEMFALHFFAGLGHAHVGLLTGTDADTVRDRCAALLDRLAPTDARR